MPGRRSLKPGFVVTEPQKMLESGNSKHSKAPAPIIQLKVL